MKTILTIILAIEMVNLVWAYTKGGWESVGLNLIAFFTPIGVGIVVAAVVWIVIKAYEN